MPQGERDYDFHLDKQFFDDMECADVRGANLDAALKVVHRNGVYELDFTLTGDVTVACDRCLDDLQLPVESGYHIVVKYGDEFRQDSDELLEIPESDDSVNVAYRHARYPHQARPPAGQVQPRDERPAEETPRRAPRRSRRRA